MPNKHPPMKLSPDEERFLRHWMYDEVHFREGTGQAKRLQVEHRVPPADLATIIAVAIPDPREQEAAGLGPPPPGPPAWPWTEERLKLRLAEAWAIIEARRERAP
jgi:hypothetical protein